MITLDVHVFESAFKTAPASPDGAPRAAVNGSPCCMGAPVYLIYVEGSGRAGLRCCMCGQVNAEVLIAQSLIAHIPTKLPRINGGG